MKILFFIHGLYGGGAERIASILLNHFCENHETYVAVTNFKAPSYPINNRVQIIDNRIKTKIKGATRIPRFIKMWSTIRKIEPDIIISFITKTNNNALLANLFLRKKIIAHYHTSKREYKGFLENFYIQPQTKLYLSHKRTILNLVAPVKVRPFIIQVALIATVTTTTDKNP